MSGNWVTLATAPNQITAEIWVDLVRNAGITAMIRPSDAVSFLGVSALSCRVLVQESDLERARAVLEDDEPDSDPTSFSA
jgi:hypothetical protein